MTIETITAVGTMIGTVFGVAGTLILRDLRDGKNVFTKNPPQSTYEQGSYMRNHYNDELTTTLLQMQIEQKEGASALQGRLDRMYEILIRIEAGGVKLKK